MEDIEEDEEAKAKRKKAAAEAVLGKDAILDAMATSILARLPPTFDVMALRKKNMVGEISPTVVVLIQELDR